MFNAFIHIGNWKTCCMIFKSQYHRTNFHQQAANISGHWIINYPGWDKHYVSFFLFYYKLYRILLFRSWLKIIDYLIWQYCKHQDLLFSRKGPAMPPSLLNKESKDQFSTFQSPKIFNTTKKKQSIGDFLSFCQFHGQHAYLLAISLLETIQYHKAT